MDLSICKYLKKKPMKKLWLAPQKKNLRDNKVGIEGTEETLTDL